MLDFNELIFSSKAYNMVALDTKLGRISHAYLFLSKDENYLYKFSENIAKLLINLNETELVEKNNLRIEKHIHPDVKFFGESKAVDSETASTIVEDANYSPFESDKKVFVLFNVQSMNESAQNKILKTIEEPPKNTYFILAGSSANKLLPTIISRVKQIELDEIPSEKICKLLIDSGTEKIRAEICADSASGNASYAEKLATDDGFIDFYNQIVSAFFEINGSRDVLKYSVYFNGKNVDKKEFLNIFMTIARDVSMIISKAESLVINKASINKLKVVASMLNLTSTNELIDECLKQKKNLEFNVGSTSVVDSVLFKLAEVKVKCRRL